MLSLRGYSWVGQELASTRDCRGNYTRTCKHNRELTRRAAIAATDALDAKIQTPKRFGHIWRTIRKHHNWSLIDCHAGSCSFVISDAGLEQFYSAWCWIEVCLQHLLWALPPNWRRTQPFTGYGHLWPTTTLSEEFPKPFNHYAGEGHRAIEK